MKLVTTTSGEARLMRAYDSSGEDKFPIRHFLTLLMCRHDGLTIEVTYKKLCKERLTQFDHQVFAHDIQILERAGLLAKVGT